MSHQSSPRPRPFPAPNEDSEIRHTRVDEEESVLEESEPGGDLLRIIEHNDLPLLRQYLASYPACLAKEVPYYTDPFCVAAHYGSTDALRLLLEHYALTPSQNGDEPPPNARGFQLLNVACEAAELETARFLLDEQPTSGYLSDSADLNARDARNGRTAILAAAASFVKLAQREANEMLQPKFDIDAVHSRNRRAEELMRLLLDRGACARDVVYFEPSRGLQQRVIEARTETIDTVLSLAVSRAGPELLRRLIDEGADVFALTCDMSHDIGGAIFRNGPSKNVTALHLCSFYGNYQGVRVLLEHYRRGGFDLSEVVTYRDSFDRLPIHYAAAGWAGSREEDHADTIELLRLLVSGRPHITSTRDQQGDTPLHYAIDNLIHYGPALKRPAVARALCDYFDAPAGMRGRNGQTPLHRLCLVGHLLPAALIDTDLIAMLLARGADVNAADDSGNTALHLAVRYLKEVDAVRFLVARGADVRAKNAKGNTPLHEAAGSTRFIRDPPNPVAVEERMRAQDKMMTVFQEAEAGIAGAVALMDELNADGKTPRQVCEETRSVWREEEATRARGSDRTRGRGRGRGR